MHPVAGARDTDMVDRRLRSCVLLAELEDICRMQHRKEGARLPVDVACGGVLHYRVSSDDALRAP